MNLLNFVDKEVKEGKSHLKLVICAVIIILILAGSYFAVSWYLKKPIEEKEEEKEVEPKVLSPAEREPVSPEVTAKQDYEECKLVKEKIVAAVAQRNSEVCEEIPEDTGDRVPCEAFTSIAKAVDNDDLSVCDSAAAYDEVYKNICYGILKQDPSYCEKTRGAVNPRLEKKGFIEECKKMVQSLKSDSRQGSSAVCDSLKPIENLKPVCSAIATKATPQSDPTKCNNNYNFDMALFKKDKSLCEQISADDEDLKSLCHTNIGNGISCYDFACVAKELKDPTYCDKEQSPERVAKCKAALKEGATS